MSICYQRLTQVIEDVVPLLIRRMDIVFCTYQLCRFPFHLYVYRLDKMLDGLSLNESLYESMLR